MKIGLIAPPWLPVPPGQYGGTESVIDRVARGLARAGHEVLLAAPDGSSCPVPQVAGLGTADPDRIGQVVIEIPYALAAYEALRGVDIVHDHTVAGPLCARVPDGVPLVTTNHGPFDENLGPIYAEMSRRGVAVVAISTHQASTAPDVRIAAVIHHGIDVADVPMGDGGGGYACFLGRMVPDKGVREAVLAARAAEMPLRIAAKMREPEEEQYFEEVVQPLLGGNIEYIGELDHEDKYELLGNAVALLNPLQWPEPFGLVMIEALACGTPVVASSDGSVPEIVTDGVTGFIREDTTSVAEALRQVTTLSRAACREAAETSFSTSRMVADHVKLYEQLLLTSEGANTSR
jgi:glycosyltransferase involved in cell wall biosynthesis